MHVRTAVAAGAALMGLWVPSAAQAVSVERAPTVAETVARATALGVGADARATRRSFRPAARLVPTSYGNWLGGPQLGGRPTLPRRMRWPRCHGRPLSFLAQFDIGNLRGTVRDARVGGAGTLYVFGDLHEDDDGIPPIELVHGLVRRTCAVVVRHTYERNDALAPRTPPRGARRLRRIDVHLRPTLTVPDDHVVETLTGRTFRLGKRYDAWWRLFREAATGVLGRPPGVAPMHQLLGWPSPVQDSPLYGCGGRITTHRLLLQLDYDPQLGFEVGDGAVLYLTLSARDLAAGRFDRLCAETQEG